jgi:hypothetical protein
VAGIASHYEPEYKHASKILKVFSCTIRGVHISK